jgi:hypothetical protein
VRLDNKEGNRAMRAIHIILLASAALGAAALAQDAGKTTSAAPERPGVAPIHFDLATPKPARRESLPTAATLGELTYATDNQPAAKAAARTTAKAAPKPRPKPVAKPVAAKAIAAKPVVAKPSKGPWMSEWRRAYIAKHGHQPPVPAR